MINLLPPKEKEELLLQKNRNLTVVLGSMAIIVLICLTLVLLSLKFYILQNISSQKSAIEDVKRQYQTADFMSLKDSIQEYDSKLTKIDNFYKKQTKFSDALKTIAQIQRPDGVTFGNIVLEKSDTAGKVKVSIYGQSTIRDGLVLFKDNLGKENSVSNLNIPADNWIKPTNISFNLTFDVGILNNESQK